jgi:hypothetical protein
VRHQPPGENGTHRQTIPGPQLAVQRDVFGGHRAVGNRGQPGFGIAMQHLLQRLQLFGVAESGVLLHPLE